MDRTNKLTCPHCGVSLKSVRGVRIGKKIKCVKCQVPFIVRPEDAEQAAGVNSGRLAFVLFGALLYLLGGSGLAFYCFATNHPRTDTIAVAADQPDDADETSPISITASAVSAAEQRDIDNAIARGVWFLRDSQLANGTWNNDLPVGYAALAALTLLECGVPPDDPGVQNAAALVRNQAPPLAAAYANYQKALAILFLDRLGEVKDKELIQYLAVSLIAGQDTSGAWTYSSPALDRKQLPELLKLLADKKTPLQDWRKTATPGGYDTGGAWDNSNTQFVVLALWVAQRHGVAIDKPIAAVESHFRTTQQPPGKDTKGKNLDLGGSWLYNTTVNSSAWPSMTCSGLLALAIGQGVAADEKAQHQKILDDPAVKSALAMLSREIDRSDEKRGPDYYFLWSLERVGVLFDLEKIDGKDWYAWGRKILLPRQQENGSWVDGGFYDNNPTLNTCFVLLFLKQANLAKDLTSKLELLSEKK